MPIPLPAMQLNPAPDPLESYGKFIQLSSLLQGRRQQQEMYPLEKQKAQIEVKNAQMQQDQLQRQQQDDQTVMQAIAAMPGATLHDVLPKLSGSLSPAGWMRYDEADRKRQDELRKATKDDLDIQTAQHGQYQQVFEGVMAMPDEQIPQQWPQIVQAIDSIPGNKFKLDPTKPLNKQQLAQFGPFLAMNQSYLDREIQRRQAKAQATEAEANAGKAQKVNAGTNAQGVTAEQRATIGQGNQRIGLERQQQAETQRHNQATEDIRDLQVSTKDADFIDKNYVKPANDVEKSWLMMDNAYREFQDARKQGKKLPTGAQSMVALSTHLSTTFGNVKGARVTKDMIREHLGARSVGDSALVAIQKLSNGDQLSPEQWTAFHDLIKQSRNISWDTVKKEAKRRGVDVTGSLPPDVGGKATPSGKTLSMSAIQQAAKDHGVSVDEAKRQAIAAGYEVQ